MPTLTEKRWVMPARHLQDVELPITGTGTIYLITPTGITRHLTFAAAVLAGEAARVPFDVTQEES